MDCQVTPKAFLGLDDLRRDLEPGGFPGDPDTSANARFGTLSARIGLRF